MTNPIRWLLTKAVHFYLWWSRMNPPKPRPMTEPRYKCGHLKQHGAATCGDMYCTPSF